MSSRGWRANSWRGRGGNSRGNWRGRSGGSRGRGDTRSSTREKSKSRQGGHSHVRQQVQTLFTCPYKNWIWYLSDEAYVPNSPLVNKVEAFKKYFESHISKFSKEKVENEHSFCVEYSDLIHDVGLVEEIPSLVQDIREKPEKTLQIMGLAFYQVMSCSDSRAISQACEGNLAGSSDLFDLPYIRARITNFEPHTPLKNLKANYFGKFVAVRGSVVRVSNVKPLVTKMAFACNLCQEIQVINLPDGKYMLPTKCISSECRGRLFDPQRSSTLTETIDWQTVRVQEIMDDGQREAGRIPRTVECELFADLVDSCVPGDMVTITGVVKVSNAEEGRSRHNKDKCMFLLYIHANSVNNNRGTLSSGEQANGLSMEFTLKELYAIQEIQSEKNLFRLIVGSLCPSIYGHEMVKAGLILGVFGGTQRFANDKNRIPVRGNPHVLVVGDPGLGKSQMLQAVAAIAPRGVYVCGNTTSTSGLTVTLCKDGSSGDYALEAGALVLGDQGCCCIDEFDKMGQQHQALLEAMEQQSISIAKAGIVCSLPARTSIIAAANPTGGHYNKGKTVSENLKMGSALLSRFDLVFILLDKPDEEMDSLLSDHVMALHAGNKSTAFNKVTVHRTESTSSSSDEGGFMKGSEEEREEDDDLKQWRADQPLSERLKIGRNENFDAIPGPLLRKKFYLDLRQQHHSSDSTPITTRQLESLIRLTEARARLELREKATRQDAEDVIQIMKYSMLDTYSDDLGFLDFNRSQHGSGMSSRNQAKRFVAELSRIADCEYNSLFTVERMRGIAKDLRLKVRNFDDFLYSLNNQGFLLKKGARVYQLQTTSCL